MGYDLFYFFQQHGYMMILAIWFSIWLFVLPNGIKSV